LAIKGHQLIAPQGGSSHGDHAIGKVPARIQQTQAELHGGGSTTTERELISALIALLHSALLK
jgi:hypothetical protein